MKGNITNIEKTTDDNEDFRRVLYTAKNCQLVLMSLKPMEEIGEEVHDGDQFIHLEKGKGKAILDGVEHDISDDDSVMIPACTRHNIINTSATEPARMYSIYAPPQHKDGTVHATKDDAMASKEHFDGETTE